MESSRVEKGKLKSSEVVEARELKLKGNEEGDMKSRKWNRNAKGNEIKRG